jgi:hypothetical protein
MSCHYNKRQRTGILSLREIFYASGTGRTPADTVEWGEEAGAFGSDVTCEVVQSGQRVCFVFTIHSLLLFFVCLTPYKECIRIARQLTC